MLKFIPAVSMGTDETQTSFIHVFLQTQINSQFPEFINQNNLQLVLQQRNFAAQLYLSSTTLLM